MGVVCPVGLVVGKGQKLNDSSRRMYKDSKQLYTFSQTVSHSATYKQPNNTSQLQVLRHPGQNPSATASHSEESASG